MILSAYINSESSASKRGITQLFSLLLCAFIVTFIALTVGLFYTQTEDAYLVFRYALNLVDHGALVYNLGDRICALTSPLHALLVASLYYAFGSIIIPNKLMGLLCFLLTMSSLAYALRKDAFAVLATLSLLLISPYVVLWTYGGLETPLLMLLVSTFSILVYKSMGCSGTKHNYTVLCFWLAGMAILTRYDTVLFVGPALLALTLAQPSRKKAFIAAGIGALAPIAWLIFAALYYGDIFPTSYYVKTPSIDWWKNVYNALYMGDFYIFSGIGVLHIVILVLLLFTSNRRKIWVEHWHRMWWVYVGIVFVVGYGLTTATTHMMYSFRLLLPYLTAIALLLGDIIQSIRKQNINENIRMGTDWALLCTIAMIFFMQLANSGQLWKGNNLSGARNGEFRYMNARYMSNFVAMYRSPAKAIRNHWKHQPASHRRQLRLCTFAAGILPFELKEAYVLEELTSYRHERTIKIRQLMTAADYICVLWPRHGTLDAQLPRSPDQFERVFQTSLSLDGSMQTYTIFYNPKADVNILPKRIDGKFVDSEPAMAMLRCGVTETGREP